MRIRPVVFADRQRLLALWERSVRATHHFLTEGDVAALRPLVALELASSHPEWWALSSDKQEIVGFLGWSPNTIEALFVDPAFRQMGFGRTLVAFAQELAHGAALTVEVNEQNEQAVRFYRTIGFAVIGRSATDPNGKPFPILRMRRPVPPRSHAGNDLQRAR